MTIHEINTMLLLKTHYYTIFVITSDCDLTWILVKWWDRNLFICSIL